MNQRGRVALIAMIVVALSLALAGCAASPSAPAETAPAATTAATPPTIKVLAPLGGAELADGGVEVKVETTGLKFVMPSNTVVPGEGHVHFTLDDQPVQMSTTPGYTFKNVAPGAHTLKAELVQNNTDEFEPPVFQVVEFDVK